MVSCNYLFDATIGFLQLSVSCNYRFLATIGFLKLSVSCNYQFIAILRIVFDWLVSWQFWHFSDVIYLSLDISGKKKSRFGPVSDLSYAIIVILSIETAGIVILRCVTIGTVAAPA